MIDLDGLAYDQLRGADSYQIDLLSPYVRRSGWPGADEQAIPWWWAATDDDLRHRTERLVSGEQTYDLWTVDHGQTVGYTGDEPVATARQGIQRVGTHSQFGVGEFRLRPAGQDRVPERGALADGSLPVASETPGGHD